MNAPILAYGGVDVDTNQPFEGMLKAPLNFDNVTPVSTIVNEYIEQGKSETEALEKVAEVLGVDNPEDLKKDPIAELSSNPELLKANLKFKDFRGFSNFKEDIANLG